MSRTTDIERGARLAHDIAIQWLAEVPLFPALAANEAELRQEMFGIAAAANRTIAECEWSRQVIAG